MNYEEKNENKRNVLPANPWVILVVGGFIVTFLGFAYFSSFAEENPEAIETNGAGSWMDYPGFQISSSNGKTAYGRMEYDSFSRLYEDADQTWLLRTELPAENNGMQRTVRVMIKVKDINNIPDVNVKLPNGENIYAKNFRMDPDYYMPRLLADQEGFYSISVSYFPYKEPSKSSITGLIGANSEWKENPGVVLERTEGEAFLVEISARY